MYLVGSTKQWRSNWPKVIVEVNAFWYFWWVCKKCPSAIAYFRWDACNLVKNFNNCVFHWVSRKANNVAHALVKFTTFKESFVFVTKILSMSLTLWKRHSWEMDSVFFNIKPFALISEKKKINPKSVNQKAKGPSLKASIGGCIGNMS